MFYRPTKTIVLVLIFATIAAETPGASGKPRLEERANASVSCTTRGSHSFLANSDSNDAAGAQASIIGGSQNSACDDDSTVAGGSLNVISTGNDSGPQSFLGAGTSNNISGSGSFIGAGTANSVTATDASLVAGNSNLLQGPYAFLGGGALNLGNAYEGALGGGENNSMPGGYLGMVVGGNGNSLSVCTSCANGQNTYASFVGGGVNNSAYGSTEFVGGGGGNVAYGQWSSVLGGYHNLARGLGSFAGGFGAYAVADGSFVWADFSPGSPHLTSTKPAEFLVRASGGTSFYSNASATTGVYLAPGSGAWSSASDVNLKSHITSFDEVDLLANLVQLPFSRWSYDSEAGVQHLGPMAQDFYRLFGVGTDDRHIETIDEGGIALAALKAVDNETTSLIREDAQLFEHFTTLYRGTNILASLIVTAFRSRDKARPTESNVSSCVTPGAGSFLANTSQNVAAGKTSSILGGANQSVCDDDSVIGAGMQNIIDSGGDTAQSSFIAAGTQNGISGGESFVGSGNGNQISGGIAESIASGSGNEIVSSSDGFITAGTDNSLVDSAGSTMGAGEHNTITSVNGSLVETDGALDSVLGGGFKNSIAATSISGAEYSLLAGGYMNSLNGSMAVLAGGFMNKAPGELSTVADGDDNVAGGELSFAAGSSAYAMANGSFAFTGFYSQGYSKDLPLPSANSFLVNAPGGVTFFSNASQTTGAILAAGSGSWASASDRKLKVDARAVDGSKVEAMLADLPISEWSYREESGVRHIGPMAQDFFERFHVGEDDRHISTIDEDGVALVAVKSLHVRIATLAKAEADSEHELSLLVSENASLNARIQQKAISSCSAAGSGSFLANDQSNVASGAESSVAGGTSNSSCDDDSTIGGGTNNTINSGNDSGTFSFIAAGSNNSISSIESFIGAGDTNSIESSASAAILGGQGNQISEAPESFIGGGSENAISSVTAGTILAGQGNVITAVNGSKVEVNGATDAAIAGGAQNTIAAKAPGGARYGFIGAGEANLVTGTMGVVLGGYGNVASGEAATVPGGYQNVAAGDDSFAAGYQAHAMTPGSFVWADYSPGSAPLTATKANQFLVRASGGVVLFTNPRQSAGVQLRPGSGSWASASDRNIKSAITPVDCADLLRKVASLPISEWSYKSEFGVRHIGPMAQDFYATFHVGEDNKHIAVVDEDGVTLAAVKALVSEERALKIRRQNLISRLVATEMINLKLQRQLLGK